MMWCEGCQHMMQEWNINGAEHLVCTLSPDTDVLMVAKCNRRKKAVPSWFTFCYECQFREDTPTGIERCGLHSHRIEHGGGCTYAKTPHPDCSTCKHYDCPDKGYGPCDHWRQK